jgi:hypothetical protein
MIALCSESGAASHKRLPTAVWHMSNCRCLVVLALLLPSIAEAASVIKPIVACKDEADSRKVLDFLAKNDKRGWTNSVRQNSLRAIAYPFRKAWP